MQKPGCRFALRLCSLLTVIACSLRSAPSYAEGQLTEMAGRVGIQILAEGRSGGRMRETSSRQLPWQGLTARNRQRVKDVLDDCAQYRRLPELRYEVHPDIYRYLVQHPDVAVSTWRAMGISKVQMWQTGPLEYEATAPDGSLGLADVLYQDAQQCLLLCDGTYSSPLLPRPITASGLVWLRYEFRPGKNGAMQVHQQLDVYVSFPSATARAMALLASPVTNMMMDRNAFEISLYARMMSQAAKSDPDWICRMARNLEGVLPRRRQELARIVRPVETDRDRTTSVSGRITRRQQAMRTFRTSMMEVENSVPQLLSAAGGSAEPGQQPAGFLRLQAPVDESKQSSGAADSHATGARSKRL